MLRKPWMLNSIVFDNVANNLLHFTVKAYFLVFQKWIWLNFS